MNIGGKEKIIYHVTEEQFAEVKEDAVIFYDKDEILEDYISGIMSKGNDITKEIIEMARYSGNYANQLISEDRFHIIRLDGNKGVIYARIDNLTTSEKLRKWNIDNLVNSDEESKRKQAVKIGDETVWKRLIDDPKSSVRLEIAKHYYELDRLMNDKCETVRIIARQYQQRLENKMKKETNLLSKETKIAELGVSPRARMSLSRNGVDTLGELLELSAEDIAGIKNIGKRASAELIRVQEKAIEGLKNKKSVSAFLEREGL